MDKSAADREVVHCARDAQDVDRVKPATWMVEPSPGLDATKLPPKMLSVNHPDEPTYALDGAKEEINGPLEMVTAAEADWPVSSELVAEMRIELGEGGERGAV